MLPIVPGKPFVMHGLCQSPIHAGLGMALRKRLNEKISFVGIHLSWNYLLEPTNDLCADVTISDSEAFRRARARAEADAVLECGIGCRLPSFQAYVDEAKLVDPSGDCCRVPMPRN